MEPINWLSGVVFPYINFALFLVVIVYFFRKPLGQMALKRRETFEAAAREARRAKEEAEQRLRELQARMAGLEAEMTAVRDNATKAAEDEARLIVANAEALAVHLRAEAQRVAENELERARRALRQEIAQAVRHNVEQRIRTGLTPADHLRLVQTDTNRLKTLNAEG